MTDNPDALSDFVNDSPQPGNGPVVILLKVLGVIAIIGMVGAFLLPAVRTPREAARRTQCKNNLKHIGLALHNFHEVHGAFPPAYTVDANGKPLHSWRTLILPYLDQAALYNTINLSKAWDDPANAAAFKAQIGTYRCPSDRGLSTAGRSNQTTYLAIVGPNTCFPATKSRRLSEITDGTSNTLMVIEGESRQAVHWMSPLDADEKLVLSLAPDSKLSHVGGMHVLNADGSVRFLSAKLPADQRRALISVAGQDNVGEF